MPIPSARTDATRPETPTFAPACTMVIWTFVPGFKGVRVGTKHPRMLKLLVRAEICRSECTSMITIAATNGFRNARGRLAIFKVGSRWIGEGPDGLAGLVHVQTVVRQGGHGSGGGWPVSPLSG